MKKITYGKTVYDNKEIKAVLRTLKKSTQMGESVNRFEKKIGGDNHYCQGCAKFINKKYLVREVKSYGRLRCSCCNGLVRNKPRLYRASSAQAIKNIIFSS